MSKVMDGGIVTAYGAAVRGGYTGTYQQFCAALGQLAEVLEEFEGFSVEVTTLSPGAPATANYHDGVLTLGIPRGETGNGIQSAVLNSDYTLTLTWTNGQHTTVGPIRGAVGATPNLTIGNVQTLQPSQPATATITGTPEDPVLNFGIPKGNPGTNGVSPAVTITEITDGHRVTITDGDHPQGQSFDVMDGQDGASDAGDVTYDETATYQSGTVGAELSSQKNAISQLGNVVNDPVRGLAQKAPLIVNNASGDIASFHDGADDMPIKSLVASIEPVQDLHGYSNPWPEGGGKNLFGGEFNVLFPLHFDVDTQIKVSANMHSTGNVAFGFFDENQTRIDYFGLSSTYSDVNDRVARAIMLPKETYYVSFYNQESADYQIELGSTNTPFAPYANECPISGHTGLTVARTGKNLFDQEAFLSGTGITKTADGYYTGTSSAFRSWLSARNGQFLDHPKSGEQITISYIYRGGSADQSGFTLYIVYTDGTSNYVRSIAATDTLFQITSVSGKTIASFEISYNTNTTIYLKDFQIEPSSTASTYEPYTGTTIPITFPETVYGGSDEVIGGALESTMGMVDLGTLNWEYISSVQRFQATVSGIKTYPSYYMTIDCVCEIFKVGTVNSAPQSNAELVQTINSDQIRVRLDNTTLEEFISIVNGKKLVYALATPQTFTREGQQIDTLYGQNNVWTDVGDVSINYPADTKLYIDNKIATAVANALNA